MTPETRKLLMSELGKLGAAAKQAKTTPEQRQGIAASAGKMGWSKLSPEQKQARLQKLHDSRRKPLDN